MDKAKSEVVKEKLAIFASNIIEGCSTENSFKGPQIPMRTVARVQF